MKTIQKDIHVLGLVFLLTWLLLSANLLLAQTAKAKKQILVDISHGQKFWNSPADMKGKDPQLVQKINYMTGELKKNATALNATVQYQKSKITPVALAKCDLLFIHISSSKYATELLDYCLAQPVAS